VAEALAEIEADFDAAVLAGEPCEIDLEALLAGPYNPSKKKTASAKTVSKKARR
jgi:hypothetical protein